MSAPAHARPATGLLAVVAAAVRDLLDHPVPLIAANVVWGGVALVAWTAWLVSPVTGFLGSVILAWPAAAVAQVAGRVVRGESVSLRGALAWPLTRSAVPILGLLAVLGAAIAIVDVAAGLASGDAFGTAVATVAAWTGVALMVLCSVVWPLLGDPWRHGRGLAQMLRQAVSVVLLHTARVLGATAVAVLVLVGSAILVAPLLTVSLSFAALLLSRVILPLADERDATLETARQG